jgi:hypothetical protein
MIIRAVIFVDNVGRLLKDIQIRPELVRQCNL